MLGGKNITYRFFLISSEGIFNLMLGGKNIKYKLTP